MTNEQKLSKLIQIAVENGWKAPLHIREWLIVGNESYGCGSLKACTVILKKGEFAEFSIRCGHWEMSIDYLILNFEEGAICFLSALRKALNDKNISFNSIDTFGRTTFLIEDFTFDELVAMNWVLLPTSKRLEWLFETFKHLL